jgi:hypothetical protein
LKTKTDKTKFDLQGELTFVWGKLQMLQEFREDSDEDAKSKDDTQWQQFKREARGCNYTSFPSSTHPWSGTKTTPATGPGGPCRRDKEMKTSMPDTKLLW